MIKLKTVKVTNFLSFGNKQTEVNLDKEQTLLIVGDNQDVGTSGTSKNGAGKSSIMQAIIYAIYGSGIDPLKSDDFINNINQKKMLVELTFDINGNEYTVKRGRKPNIVELYCGDESLTRDSMKNTDDDILKLVGMPVDVFVGVYFLSPHKESFMAKTPAKQRDFLENILSIDVLAERAEQLKLLRKDIQVELKLVERDLENAETTNNKAQDNIDRIKTKINQWDIQVKEKIQKLTGDTVIDFDIEHERNLLEELERINTEINNLNDQIKVLDGTDSNEKTSISNLENDVNDYKDAINKKDTFTQEVETELKEVREEIEKYGSMDELFNDVETFDELCGLYDELNTEVRGVERDIQDIKKEIGVCEKQEEKLVSEKNSLEDGKCPYCKQSHIDEATLDGVVSELEGFSDESNSLKKQLSEKNQQLEELLKTKQEYDEHSDSYKKKAEQAKEKLRKTEKLIEREDVLVEKTNPYEYTVEALLKRHGSLEEMEQRLLLERKQNSKTNQLLATKNEEVQEKRSKIRDLESECKFRSTSTLNDVLSKREKAVDELNRLEAEENPYTGEIEHAEQMFVDTENLLDKKDDLDKREKHCGYLVKLLTDPKSFIRKNIVDQYIPFMNKKINEYSQSLGLPHVTEIQSDMTVDITNMGRHTGYFNMSQGERLRLNVSTSMAMKDIMNMMGKGFNMLLVDELFDSALDSYGMIQMFKFVKDKSSNVWIISHREEFDDMVDNKMIVSKKDGFSHIDLI